MKSDFSGYATRAGVLCSDGRTIKPDAFAHNDGERVPLVWQHLHDSPENVLGHALLENRPDGVYAYAFFNDSQRAQSAKESVRHGDINRMSIFANKLVERDHIVHQGVIREVSLVLAGANPEATIDNVTIKHSDGGVSVVPDTAIIQSDVYLSHAEDDQKEADMADNKTEEGQKTLGEVLDTLTEEQAQAVGFLLEQQASEDDTDDDSDSGESLAQSALLDDDGNINPVIHKELFNMTDSIVRNRFTEAEKTGQNENTISHDDMKTIFNNAQRSGSLKSAMMDYAEEKQLAHAIENIETLFPDFKLEGGLQKWDRRTEWVDKVIGGCSKQPTARIRTLMADLTGEEARAKGYIKGNLKKEQVFKLLKRTTEPTTVYKKQAIDRDDLIDITDFNIVDFYRQELRAKLYEEIARAILIGDGRSESSEDKIDEARIRPIANEDDFYAPKLELPTNITPEETVKTIIRARNQYRGSGEPTLYTSMEWVTELLLIEDKIGNRKYESVQQLATVLRVKEIVDIEHLSEAPDVIGIIVNLTDYRLGTDRGGEATTFEDFDIDYNKHKYLIETRLSGALNKPMSALVLKRNPGTEVTPQAPSFNGENDTILIPTVAGIEYRIKDTVVTGTVNIEETTYVEAFAKEGNFIPAGTNRQWVYSPSAE